VGVLVVECLHAERDWRVNRIKIVQEVLDGRAEPLYLEIGVSRGSAFQRIVADKKIAVDPAFRLSPRARRLADSKARATYYFETTSDAFFANETALLERHRIDAALIDGLHTYEQALRDIENALRFLRDDGVIVVHDCNPGHASVAFPGASYDDFRAQHRWWDPRLYSGAWSGDVWKALVNLRSTRTDLRVAVLDCDFGVGLIRKGSPESTLSYSAEEIDALDYTDLAADRKGLLNLKPPTYLGEFLELENGTSSGPE
jgi:SAM-dependent methyltransferase